jgi:hypothetical protein
MPKRKKHWLARRFYWMVGATQNPHHVDYPWASQYGCDWSTGPGQFQDFIEFVEGQLGQPPQGQPFLSRVDPTKGYTRKNLAWQSSREIGNKSVRGNTYICFRGQTRTMKAWSEELGLNYHTFRMRVQLGWTMRKIASTPAREYQR